MKYFCFVIFFTFGINSIHAQNIHFIKSYGNNGYDFGRDIKQDIDTGYIATGSSSSFNSGNADAFLLKVDSLGNFKWSYNYGGNGSDWGESVVVTKENGYALGGYTNSMGNGGFDFYLVKTNSTGVPLFEKTYGGSDWDKAYDLVELNDSGYVLVGETYSYGEGNSDIYIIRTDKNGDTLWTRSYGGAEADYANAVLLDGDSIVVVGGTKSFGKGMTDGIILKYHINGNLGWTKTAGMERDDYFTSVTFDVNLNYSLGGTRDYNHFQNCDCGNDFWLYNITKNGVSNFVDTTRRGTDQDGTDIIYDLFVGNDDRTYFGGSTTSWGSQDISKGFTDAFLGRFRTSFTPSPYIGNFGTLNNDAVYAIEPTTDNGLISIGNLFYNNTGGYNLFIAKIDENESTGHIQVTQELTKETITLDLTKTQLSNAKNHINFYPNIVDNYINILNVDKEYHYSIFNINGTLVKSRTSNDTQLNFSDLNSGFYIISFEIENNLINYKFFKN